MAFGSIADPGDTILILYWVARDVVVSGKKFRLKPVFNI
jgi:hypothetical protein